MARRRPPEKVPLPVIHDDPRAYASALAHNLKVDLYGKSPVEKAEIMLRRSRERMVKLQAASAPQTILDHEMELTAKYERRLERARRRAAK